MDNALLFLKKKYIVWVPIALLIPLFVNVSLHKWLTAPSAKKINQLQITESLLKWKPELESLLNKSNHLSAEWEERGAIEENPTGALRIIQKIAEDCRVQIKEIQMGNQRIAYDLKGNNFGASGSPFAKVPLTLEVTGSYAALIQWLSEIEDKPIAQIDDWSIEALREANGTCRLNATMSIVVTNR